ncbi:Anaphase-promoting complex subunit 23 [Agyrium rufum]|nr:Anaphase-promoting complex subunit 23 [Agyrium rufum]
MATLSRADSLNIRNTLLRASYECSERCLYQSAKWAAELATSLDLDDEDHSLDDELDDQNGQATEPNSPMEEDDRRAGGRVGSPPDHSLLAEVVLPKIDAREARLETRELPRYRLAKSFFDCKEFDRCSTIFLPTGLPKAPVGTGIGTGIPSSPTNPAKRSPLKPSANKGKGKSRFSGPRGSGETGLPAQEGLPRMSQKSLFLTLYAKYMSGEKKKDEETEMVLGPSDGGTVVNRELVGISSILGSYFQKRGLDAPSSGWLEYLYGMVLATGKNEGDAKQWLIRSVRLCPYNWGAWLELSDLLESQDDLHQVVPHLDQNISTLLFHLHASQELSIHTQTTQHLLASLTQIFPRSLFILSTSALLSYHAKDFDSALTSFQTLLHTDPYRLETLDIYSNILYVLSSTPQLAFLASLATSIDKFRPETCCIVGNYYSLKSEHEKAVMYFRRALTLDRNFLSAWTLMGHEFVEMKNTHAAIESYRRAVDVNRKDYRAWYGLGQTYEVLEMHLYALFYYQRAAGLRPWDPKMWQAVGACLEKIGRYAASVKAYKRALVAGAKAAAAENSGTGLNSFGSGLGYGGESGSDGSGGGVLGPLDPEILFQIALCFEKSGNDGEAKEYMELTLAQEEGGFMTGGGGSPSAGDRMSLGDGDISILTQDYDDSTAHDGMHPRGLDPRSSFGTAGGGVGNARPGFDISVTDSGAGTGAGTGVTNTTSKARMWLAQWAFAHREFKRAMQLANELCQDGVEVEEAKALIRDLRARMEG